MTVSPSRRARALAVIAGLAVPTLACLLATVASACIPSGDETAINAALQQAPHRALLCRHAVFNIAHSIVLGEPGSELATDRPRNDKDPALIRVTGPDLATAIQSGASKIFIHDLAVDGDRRDLGRLPKGGALIEVGGAVDGLTVDHVRAQDPRGWSVLHVFEGSRNCSGARITHNTLGPAGSADQAWADGISFACRNGVVAHNRVIDATDGAIVLFGAPGTVVEDNVIVAKHNELLGGINLVDFKPFDGDYSGTVVRRNRIDSQGSFIKVAIAVGPAVWGSDKGTHNHGGTIVDNLIVGNEVGYGIAVDGVDDFVVSGNRIKAHLGGKSGDHCIPGQSHPGQAMVRNPDTSNGKFQKEFVSAPLRYAICAIR